MVGRRRVCNKLMRRGYEIFALGFVHASCRQRSWNIIKYARVQPKACFNLVLKIYHHSMKCLQPRVVLPSHLKRHPPLCHRQIF
jgi:hypothetical protein